MVLAILLTGYFAGLLTTLIFQFRKTMKDLNQRSAK